MLLKRGVEIGSATLAAQPTGRINGVGYMGSG